MLGSAKTNRPMQTSVLPGIILRRCLPNAKLASRLELVYCIEVAVRDAVAARERTCLVDKGVLLGAYLGFS
jgi:hypothetical protein